MDQLEREERYLDEKYENGEISSQEHAEEIDELYRGYRDGAREAAQEAYDREMERW